MNERAISIGLAAVLSRAASMAAETAVRPVELKDGGHGVGLYIGNEMKCCFPVDLKEQEDKNVVLKESLNFFKDIFVAAVKSGLVDLYKEMEETSWRQLVDEFHRGFYDCRTGVYSTSWFGHSVLKSPFDLMAYQEMIYQLKPDLVVETGTLYGGAALFAANICDVIGKGRILSIDVASKGSPEHSRIRYLTGSSVSKKVLDQVRDECVGKNVVLVTLDSDHRKDHVLLEMELYSSVVTVASYMIVEDTNINGHPVAQDFGPGPWEAVEEFLKTHDEFVQDRSREHYPFTFNPGGYLKKIK